MRSRITRRYLAGLLDGEGYIGILPADKDNRFYFKPVIKIVMTSPEAIKEIHLLLGGYIHIRTRHNPLHKDAYCWQVSTFVQVDKILDYVHKYLIVKKSQADVLREFLNTKENNCYKIGKGNGIKGNGLFLKPEVFAKRQRLYSLMKTLNHRGNSHPQRLNEEAPLKITDEAIVRASGKPEEISRNVNPLVT